jgi:uncharacterized repeat protein (TIGR04076 family)
MAYKVEVTIVSIGGECPAGHKVGESWLIGNTTPGGMCSGAYDTIAPYIRTLRAGGEFSWADSKDVVRLACPDPDIPVVLELRRIRE